MPKTKPHILLVDDRVNMLRLLEKVLREDGTIHTAASGAEAVSLLERLSVSAVVCDLRMPDMSGIDVLRVSKRLQPAAEFVLMTAYASVPTAVQAMREGAYDYVTKPFHPAALRAVVLRALGRAPALDGQAAHELEQSDETSAGLIAPAPAVKQSAEPGDSEHPSAEAGDADSSELNTSLVSMTWQEAMALGRRETARQYLQAVMRTYGGRIAEAAIHAGVERESFYRLLRRHGVQIERNPTEPDK
jgi:DNA-binding NtrC family response regulator